MEGNDKKKSGEKMKFDPNDPKHWKDFDPFAKATEYVDGKSEKSVQISRANRTVRKGIKLDFTEQGRIAHTENARSIANKRQYSHTIYQGTCIETGKKIKLDIHGLREAGFNPANVSRVVNGHKNSHRGYIWKILKKELK